MNKNIAAFGAGLVGGYVSGKIANRPKEIIAENMKDEDFSAGGTNWKDPDKAGGVSEQSPGSSKSTGLVAKAAGGIPMGEVPGGGVVDTKLTPEQMQEQANLVATESNANMSDEALYGKPVPVNTDPVGTFVPPEKKTAPMAGSSEGPGGITGIINKPLSIPAGASTAQPGNVTQMKPRSDGTVDRLNKTVNALLKEGYTKEAMELMQTSDVLRKNAFADATRKARPLMQAWVMGGDHKALENAMNSTFPDGKQYQIEKNEDGTYNVSAGEQTYKNVTADQLTQTAAMAFQNEDSYFDKVYSTMEKKEARREKLEDKATDLANKNAGAKTLQEQRASDAKDLAEKKQRLDIEKAETLHKKGIGKDGSDKRTAHEKDAQALVDAGVYPDMKTALPIVMGNKGATPADIQRTAQMFQDDQKNRGVYPGDAGYKTPQQHLDQAKDYYLKARATENDVQDLEPLRQHSANNVKTGKAVHNEDGSMSTIRSASVEDKNLNGGKITLIPTVWDGKILSAKEATERAIKSGIKWPTFESHEAATKASKELSASFQYEKQKLSSEKDTMLDSVDKGEKPANARQAKDGNWYVPDPDRPGKYLKYEP